MSELSHKEYMSNLNKVKEAETLYILDVIGTHIESILQDSRVEYKRAFPTLKNTRVYEIDLGIPVYRELFILIDVEKEQVELYVKNMNLTGAVPFFLYDTLFNERFLKDKIDLLTKVARLLSIEESKEDE